MRAFLASSFDKLFVDDRSHYYCPGNNEVRYGIDALTDAMQCLEPALDLTRVLKEVVFLMAAEEWDAEKHVFIVIDDIPSLALFGQELQQAISLDEQENAHCIFHVLHIGEDALVRDACEQNGVEYVSLPDDPPTVAQAIRDHYRDFNR